MQMSHKTTARLSRRWMTRRATAVAAIALLGAGLSAALAGSAQAAYPGSDGLIAFVRGGNIYTINPAVHPAPQVRLTTGGHNSGPRWSPSGKQIAYIDRGNLWVMNANGSHKRRITHAAPGYTDSRPTWSPNGKYLAFVETKRGHAYGNLTRYSFVAHSLRTFTTTINGHLIAVAALPAPAAWTWTPVAPKSSTYGSFIAYEGAGKLCPFPHKYCLNVLGFSSQSRYRNGAPSAEDAPTAFRLTDSDWYPNQPLRDTDLLTTRENCPGGHCTPVGLELQIGATPVVPGGYQGVYSPTGFYVAYVLNTHGHAEIYTELVDVLPKSVPGLTAGSQPDWQPVPAATAR